MHTDVARPADIETHTPRRPWARRFVAAAAGTAMVLGGFSTAPASAAPTSNCATGSVDGVEVEAQNGFVSKLNTLRQSKGLRTLVVNDRITGPSVSWSATMSSQNWLHHARDVSENDGVEPSQDYVRLVGGVVPNWRRVAENVGVSGMWSWCSTAELRSSAMRAVDGLHDAFVASNGHYRNMIGDFNQVGIGVHIDDDELWVTVRFAMGDLPAAAPTSDQAAAENYVDGVYELFVKRSATAAEKSRWVPVVLRGGRSTLTKSLSVSDEWAGSRIADFYTEILGRTADPKGRQSWLNAVAGGKRLEEVAAGFYGSDEFYNRAGGNDRAFIAALYEGILERKADGRGLDSWVEQMRRGMSRSRVAAGFYGSIESRQDRVQNLYSLILGRGVDPSGLRTWSTKLISTGDVVLAATLATSNEFFNRSQK